MPRPGSGSVTVVPFVKSITSCDSGPKPWPTPLIAIVAMPGEASLSACRSYPKIENGGLLPETRQTRYRPTATGVATAGVSWLSCRSGCIAKDNAAPNNISAMEPMNGQVQWPVLSTMYPNTTGETIAAKADPVFIIPLAVPEYLGAISIGIAHIGPTVNSAQKKPALNASATSLMS